MCTQYQTRQSICSSHDKPQHALHSASVTIRQSKHQGNNHICWLPPVTRILHADDTSQNRSAVLSHADQKTLRMIKQHPQPCGGTRHCNPLSSHHHNPPKGCR